MCASEIESERERDRGQGVASVAFRLQALMRVKRLSEGSTGRGPSSLGLTLASVVKKFHFLPEQGQQKVTLKCYFI